MYDLKMTGLLGEQYSIPFHFLSTCVFFLFFSTVVPVSVNSAQDAENHMVTEAIIEQQSESHQTDAPGQEPEKELQEETETQESKEAGGGSNEQEPQEDKVTTTEAVTETVAFEGEENPVLSDDADEPDVPFYDDVEQDGSHL